MISQTFELYFILSISSFFVGLSRGGLGGGFGLASAVIAAQILADRASSNTKVIVGGGDTAAALELFDLSKFMTHVSTGGGASLQLLSGESLIAIQSLEI